MAMGPSICKRFILTFTHVITGCLFFYVVLVAMSYFSVGTTLDLMPYNAWSRMASRATAAASTVPFAAQLTTRPSRTASLFWATWTCCAFAVHMMIVATDTKVLEDPSYHAELVRQGAHPLLALVPRRIAIALGALAYLALTLCGLERTYGPSLGHRSPVYPKWVVAALTYVTSIYFAFFVDRLANAIMRKHEPKLVAYPLAFIFLLAFSLSHFLRSNLGEQDVIPLDEKVVLGGNMPAKKSVNGEASEKDSVEKKNE